MSTKRKAPQKLAPPKASQSAKIFGRGNLDDSKTVVSGGGAAIKSRLNGLTEIVSISSDSSEEEDSEEESEHEAQPTNGEDVLMKDEGSPPPEDALETGEPSLGDLVRANAEPIDVAGAFEDPSHTLTHNQIQAPSGASLGTVLTQALKTNDISLLESCLHTTDVTSIRATIQRLDSPLAGTLLQKLAERLHRRPGRAGSLMVWVQWTLVTHGGYLATQKPLLKKLADLNRVIDERAKSLQNLLSLKGKLDMLEAQIDLRRSLHNERRRIDEDEDDEDVIYVEGQESDDEAALKPQRLTQNGDLEDISDDDSEISEDMPMTNGVIADSEDEEDSSEAENLIDDEAESTDAESGDEDEVDHDDEDSDGEESDDEAPPAKRLSTKRR